MGHDQNDLVFDIEARIVIVLKLRRCDTIALSANMNETLTRLEFSVE